MTKMKTYLYGKRVELLVRTISSVLVEKGHWCGYFPNPIPQDFIIFHSMWHMILLIILQISEIYQPFLFSVEYLVLFIICKCYLMEILCYLTFPWTKPWKYVSKKCDKKCVSLVCIDRWKSDIAAFLELNPGISMTHRHPANWKIGSPFVPPGETEFHSGPRTILQKIAQSPGVRVILIAPLQQAALWFPELMDLTQEDPIPLFVEGQDLLTQDVLIGDRVMETRHYRPSNLHAWKL